MEKRICLTLVSAITIAAIMVKPGISQNAEDSSAPVADNTALSVVSSIRGSVLPVRSAESETAKATLHSVETFRDEDFGTLTMVSSSGGIATVPYPKSYDIRLAQFEGGVQVVRFMPRIGTVWILDEGAWMEIGESTELYPGDYDIEMVADGDSIDVVRLERITGSTWMLGADGWHAITEPATASE
tara:strand:- start:170984 stop:171541 length:558 start_codon:yes stop_codon:yes gene_type:complete